MQISYSGNVIAINTVKTFIMLILVSPHFNYSTKADLNRINKYARVFNMGQTTEYKWGHVNFTKYVRYTFVQLMDMQKKLLIILRF